MSDNGERDELLSKSKDELLLLAKKLLPPKLCPRSNSSKADIADSILNARWQPKIPSFFAAAPTSKTSSGSPAKKKSKSTEVASVISGCAKSDEAEEVASVISGCAKSDEAEEVASVISGCAKSDENEEEGYAYLVIEEFALDEESKTPPPDPSRLEANRKQIELLRKMRTISDENTATLDITCPLPSLIIQCAQWFMRLPDLVKKALRITVPPQPFVIFDFEDVRKRYPGKSNEELVALPKADLYKADILAFCPTKCFGPGNLLSLVKGRKGSGSETNKLTGTHVIRHGLFLVDKWDPEKEGTKQLHEIHIENKVEKLKRIADIANLGLEMCEVIRGKKSGATRISNNDNDWNANFAKVVEYIDENLRVPSQRESTLGMWLSVQKNKSLTTARGDRMKSLNAIVSILYNRSRLRQLRSDEKNSMKKMISELKSIA
jgi:hypothetical protein